MHVSLHTEYRPVWLLLNSHDESPVMWTLDDYESAVVWETPNWSFTVDIAKSADVMQVVSSRASVSPSLK